MSGHLCEISPLRVGLEMWVGTYSPFDSTPRTGLYRGDHTSDRFYHDNFHETETLGDHFIGPWSGIGEC